MKNTQQNAIAGKSLQTFRKECVLCFVTARALLKLICDWWNNSENFLGDTRDHMIPENMKTSQLAFNFIFSPHLFFAYQAEVLEKNGKN